ncbi:MAG TPA: FAD-binding oxidoreductase [Candidatus Cybelea sp.]|nr:FAD-binding oxidoreductase [Candidatus Cybelea sp.]
MDRVDVPATTEQALAPLRAGFAGELILPGDPSYDSVRQLWNAIFDKRPALIARCRNARDVSAAVTHAKRHAMEVAVRGGGHNAGGSGSSDGGLVIDLSLMNGVTVDPAARRALVGGGATWAEFDGAAQEHGLATPGGVVSATGVGGLTLSGGIGWLRGSYGLSLDNVLAVEIVTADGAVHNANPRDGADLFWAIRGGGGNFGVVTQFEFAVHPVGPEVMLMLPIYRAEDAAPVMKAWRDFMATAPDEIGGSLVEFSTIPEDPAYPREAWNMKVMALAGVWAGPTDEGERAIAPLRRLATPLLDFSGRMRYCEVQKLYDGLFPKGGNRAYFKSMYLDRLDDAAIDEIAPRAADRPSPSSLCSVWFMGGAVGRVDAGATAFGDRSFRWMLSIDALWQKAEDDATNLGWTRGLWNDMQRFSNGRAYLNFAGLPEDGDSLRRSTYGANYARLAEIKARYDPTNLFRLNQNIVPKAAHRG